MDDILDREIAIDGCNVLCCHRNSVVIEIVLS